MRGRWVVLLAVAATWPGASGLRMGGQRALVIDGLVSPPTRLVDHCAGACPVRFAPTASRSHPKQHNLRSIETNSMSGFLEEGLGMSLVDAEFLASEPDVAMA